MTRRADPLYPSDDSSAARGDLSAALGDETAGARGTGQVRPRWTTRSRPRPADLFAAQGGLDSMVGAAAGLRALAVPLMKIANDIRWLVMVCIQVLADDSAIAFAASQGNFELNAMRPVIISNFLHSAVILADACGKLRQYKANDEGTTLREAALATGYIGAADFDRIVDPAAMAAAAPASALRGRAGPGDGKLHRVGFMPPSMAKSAPVMFPARGLARNSTRSATSSGWVNRPVGVPATAASATAAGVLPAAPARVSATPPPPSHRSVATGPGLTVLTRIPCGPTSFDRALQKLDSAALAAL